MHNIVEASFGTLPFETVQKRSLTLQDVCAGNPNLYSSQISAPGGWLYTCTLDSGSPYIHKAYYDVALSECEKNINITNVDNHVRVDPEIGTPIRLYNHWPIHGTLLATRCYGASKLYKDLGSVSVVNGSSLWVTNKPGDIYKTGVVSSYDTGSCSNRYDSSSPGARRFFVCCFCS